MGAATKTKPAGWAKTTKREWTGIIIQMHDVVDDADDDVAALADKSGSIEVDADVVAILTKAAKVEREKLVILLREYGREYCTDQGDGYKGTAKAQTAFAAKHLGPIWEAADGDKRKPVTASLVTFAELFADRFAK